ncbi:uncharacterized protein [Centruroides vittatus]|uniref:uncharacterized protein n=1 Tax=Centruroides vittatus TaxID=120091 RepID=UPI0035106B29
MYAQGKGVPMGSAVSGDICELVIRKLEERIIPSFSQNIIMYRRYVDDVLILWKKDPDVGSFVQRMNDNRYGLTLELEQHSNKEVHFLDIGIQIATDGIQTAVYRKATGSSSYITADSCDPFGYKMAAFRSLIKRAYTHSTTQEAVQKELDHLRVVAQEHGYGRLIQQLERNYLNGDGPDTPVNRNNQRTANIIILLSYNPILAPLYRKIAKRQGVDIAFRRCPSILQLLRNDKDRTNSCKLPGVYAIPLTDNRCNEELVYNGSTKRAMEVRLREHQKDIEHGRATTSLAIYASDAKIVPDFGAVKLIATTKHAEQIRWLEQIEIFKAFRSSQPINAKDEMKLSMAWQALLQKDETE